MPHPDCPSAYTRVEGRDHLGTGGSIDLTIHRAHPNPQKDFRKHVADIHLQLSAIENLVEQEHPNLGTQNLVVVSMTILVSIGDLANNTHKRVPITIPIKIPVRPYYSFSDAERDTDLDIQGIAYAPLPVEQESYTYWRQKDIHNRGKQAIGVNPNICGVQDPNFRGGSGPGLFTRHSEQALYLWMNTAEGIKNIIARLSAELRSKYPNEATFGATVKIYSVIMHIHSTKTACGVCEVSAVGMQNSQHSNNHPFPGFLERFHQRLAASDPTLLPNEPNYGTFCFVYPGQHKDVPLAQKGIKMFTTYTANTKDQIHQIVAEGHIDMLDMQDPLNQRKIFIANYKAKLDQDEIKEYDPEISGHTIFI